MPQFERGSDAALGYYWRAPEDAAERLGMSPGRSAGDRAARASILAAALIEHDGQRRRISYSRSFDWWAKGRYEGTPYSKRLVVPFLDALDDRGWIGHARQPPGAHLVANEKDSLQSAFWAGSRMVDALRGVRLQHVGPTSPIILRDEAGDPVALPRTERVHRLRRGVDEINAGLREIRVTVDPNADQANWRRSEFHLHARKLRTDGTETWACALPTPVPQVVRIFSRSRFDLHGRYYGYWQQLPKARRAELLINGEILVEPDFHWLHPQLVYAMCGEALAHDPYTTGYWPRQAGKLAWNTFINAPTTAEAVGGLLKKRHEMDDDGEPKWKWGPRQTARILEDIAEANGPIRHMFGSDAGVRLMAIDSDMAGKVMRGCRKAGIACLPVHDSFGVPARHEATVKGIMASVLDATLVTIRSTRSTTSAKTLRHNALSFPGPPSAEPVETPFPEVRTLSAEPVETPVPEVRTLPAEPVETPVPEVRTLPAEPVETPVPEVRTLPAEPLPDPQEVASEPLGVDHCPVGYGSTVPSVGPPHALPLNLASDIVMPPPSPPPPAVPSPPIVRGWWMCPPPRPWRIVEPDGVLVKGDPLLLARRAQTLVALGFDPYAGLPEGGEAVRRGG